MNASDKYINAAEKELENFCDNFLQSETEIEKYCKEKNIPYEGDPF